MAMDLSEGTRQRPTGNGMRIERLLPESILLNSSGARLARALQTKSLEVVQEVLESGADPNGANKDELRRYSLHFRRGKRFSGLPNYSVPSQVDAPAPLLLQTYSLTKEEVDLRQQNISKFWLSHDSLPLDYERHGNQLHSLIMAVGLATPEIFTYMATQADASYWKHIIARNVISETEQETSSSLAVSTPVHHALHDPDMLKAVLEAGLSPNARALMAAEQGLTPIQQAIKEGNISAIRQLRAHPDADIDIVTPILQVHSLHFAIAHLDLHLLDSLNMPLQNAKRTSLGHNLAHIACMPRSILEVQLFAPKIKQSIHDLRSINHMQHKEKVFWHQDEPTFLSVSAIQRNINRCYAPNCNGPGDATTWHEDQDPDLINTGKPAWYGIPLKARCDHSLSQSLIRFDIPKIDFAAQANVVKRLVEELGPEIMSEKDYCGNNALHYLASYRTPNEELIEWFRRTHSTHDPWLIKKNKWNHSAADLWMDSMTTTELPLQTCVWSGEWEDELDKIL